KQDRLLRIQRSGQGLSLVVDSILLRKGNSVAHALAKKGLMTLECCFWVEDASMEAKELADADHRFQKPS
ncbi:hypothetical protein Goari_010087, partial [Gossypium aridum]|nr:hypothetical protein [Gossypium aridum]